MTPVTAVISGASLHAPCINCAAGRPPRSAPFRCALESKRSARLYVGSVQSALSVRAVDRGDVCVVPSMLRGRLDRQYGGEGQCVRVRGSRKPVAEFVEPLHK